MQWLISKRVVNSNHDADHLDQQQSNSIKVLASYIIHILLQSNSCPKWKQPADHLHHSGGAALGRLGDISSHCTFMEAVNHRRPPLTNT